jgi:hypothetical protein
MQIIPIADVENEMTMFQQSSLSVSTASMRRQDERRKRQSKHTPAPQPATVLSAETMNGLTQSAEPGQLDIFGMDELALVFPDMMVRNTRLNEEDPVEHLSDPVSQLLKDHVAQLPKPVTLSAQGDDHLLAQQLKTRQKVLPLMTASLESELLQQAGLWPNPLRYGELTEYPRCMNLERCVATLFPLRGAPPQGLILMSFMYEHEMEVFRHSGTAPMEPRPCVLCCRKHVASFILSLRPNMKRVDEVDGGFVCQVVRNLVDCEGGYSSVHTFQPALDRWEGLVSPVVGFNTFCLRVVSDPAQGGRLRVDQSALIWRKPPPLRARVGETVQDFRLRVAQQAGRCSRGISEVQEAQNARQLHEVFELSQTVLRVTQAYQLSGQRLDSLPLSEQKWMAWAARTVGLQNQNLSPELTRYWDLLSHPPCLALVLACCFWCDTRNTKEIRVRLLSKVIPQPCQTRRFSVLIDSIFGVTKRKKKGTAAQRKAKQKATDEVEVKTSRALPAAQRKLMEDVTLCRQWLMLSVLGLMPAVGVRARPSFRQTVAVLKHCERDHFHQFEETLVKVPYLCIFAVREYLCHVVETCPQVQESLGLLFDWHGMARITRQTMDTVRGVLSAREKAGAPLDDESRVRMFFEALGSPGVDAECSAAHSLVLSIGYQRQRPKLMRILHTCIRGRKGKFTPETEADAKPPDLGLPLEKLKFMEEWLSRLNPAHHSLELDVWPYLGGLGVPRAAVVRATQICNRHDEERMGKRALRTALSDFCEAFPQSMYALQALCCLWNQRDHPRSYELPHHYRVNQAKALRERFNLPEGSPLPRHRVVLYYCKVCNNIYSILRQKKACLTPAQLQAESAGWVSHLRKLAKQGVVLGPEGPVWFPNDEYGMRDAQKDDRTGELFCKRNRRNGYTFCREQPLEVYPILGKVIELRSGRCYCLCPGRGCGMVMEMDAVNNRFTERGMLCSWCSARLNGQELHQLLTESRVAHGTKFKCIECGHPCHESRAHIYGPNLVVCANHHSKRLAYAVGQARPTSRKEMMAVIVQMHEVFRKEKAEREAGRNKWNLGRSRAASHSKPSYSYFAAM